MYILLTKIEENHEWVYYEFNADVLTGSYLTPQGKLRGNVENKNGFCKLNKLTEEFKLDPEKTDPFFLTDKRREVTMVYVHLRARKRKNLGFPDLLEIATG